MWFGLARQRSVVLPSWKGWLVLFALLAFVAVLVFREAYPYLTAECRVPKADVVLVEGWVADTVMEQAKREIDEGRCDWICTAGVDLDRGSYLSEYKDWATLAAENLKAMGVPEEKIFVAPGGPSQRHRTYLGHEKAKEKLVMLERSPLRINIIMEGPKGLRR